MNRWTWIGVVLISANGGDILDMRICRCVHRTCDSTGTVWIKIRGDNEHLRQKKGQTLIFQHGLFK